MVEAHASLTQRLVYEKRKHDIECSFIQNDICQFKHTRCLQHSAFIPSSIAALVEQHKILCIDVL